MIAEISSSAEVPSDKNPSQAVVKRIADLEGLDPIELTPPLYTVIDPEALDALFSSSTTADSRPSGYVSFTYRGYDVRLESDGEISITEA